MGKRLPILVILVGVVFCGFSFLGGQWQSSSLQGGQTELDHLASDSGRGEKVTEVQDRGSQTPQNLVDDAARRVLGYRSIDSRIRLRANLLGQFLVGSGRYRQLASNQDRLARLDLEVGMDQKTAHYQEVNNGRFLWTYRLVPEIDDQESAPLLERIDLRQIREALQASRNPRPLDSSIQSMLVGGLPHLLHQLADEFHFAAARKGTVQNVPVWVIHGNRVTNQAIKNTKQDKQRSKPESAFPSQVVVTLDRHDLFPYRLYFFHPSEETTELGLPAMTGGYSPNHESGVLVELFEVKIGTSIDPLTFDFRAGELSYRDVTAAYLRKLAEK